jgi:hypothetical protein
MNFDFYYSSFLFPSACNHLFQICSSGQEIRSPNFNTELPSPDPKVSYHFFNSSAARLLRFLLIDEVTEMRL